MELARRRLPLTELVKDMCNVFVGLSIVLLEFKKCKDTRERTNQWVVISTITHISRFPKDPSRPLSSSSLLV